MNELLARYRQLSLVGRWIAWHVIVYVAWQLLEVLFNLMMVRPESVNGWIALSSDLLTVATRPWTLASYIFLHANLWHLLINMLMLYFSGTLFLRYYYPRQFQTLYLMGGIAGGLFYVAAYNLFPLLSSMDGSIVIGASGAVMCILFAVAVSRPDERVRMIFVGEVKMIWLALFILLMDLLALAGSNAGGHFAHLGGALLGVLFAVRMRKGKDITAATSHLIDLLHQWTQRPIRVAYKRKPSEWKETKPSTSQAEINKILEKIKQSGYGSLSNEEKAQLFSSNKKG